MVSGSLLQVAKLAQMCPAVPSGTQQRTTAPRGGQQCSAAAKALDDPFFWEPDPINIFCQNNEPNPITIFLRHLFYEMSHNPIVI